MHFSVRRATLAIIAAVTLVGFVATLASAAGKPPTNPNNPVITFVEPSPAADAVLTDGDATYAFTFNRTPKQVATVTCALSGQASLSGSCDAPALFPSNSKTTSKSGESYTDLANGEYTFTVTLALTSGGVYTASREFTVNLPLPTFQSTCEGYGGTYGTGGTIQGFAATDRCDWTSVANATWFEATGALWPFCPGYPDINTRPLNQRASGDPSAAAVGCRDFS
jgi:hypothetical protein